MTKKNYRRDYRCSTCGIEGHKLWRQYQTCASAIDLLCAVCAEADQGKTLDIAEHDQIGWLVPAVPTAEGDTFWGYSSVPPGDVAWWHDLPTFADATRELAYLRAWAKKAHAQATGYAIRLNDWHAFGHFVGKALANAVNTLTGLDVYFNLCPSPHQTEHLQFWMIDKETSRRTIVKIPYDSAAASAAKGPLDEHAKRWLAKALKDAR